MIIRSATTTATPTQATTITPIVATTVSPAVAEQYSQIIDSLSTAVALTKDQILAFPGDSALTKDLLTQSDQLSNTVKTLKAAIPSTSLTQINDVAKGVQALKNDLNNLLHEYQGNFTKCNQQKEFI